MEPPNLSESHSRHLLVRWQEIDRLMSEIEQVLSAGDSAEIQGGTVPVQVRVIRDYIANIRRELLQSATLEDLRERFDAYAESYRAKIARLEGVTQAAGTDGGGSLEQDLARLRLEAPVE